MTQAEAPERTRSANSNPDVIQSAFANVASSERPWQYKLHEESIFYQRLNFFLVAESMLFVAFTTVWNTTVHRKAMLLSLGILGLLLTGIWAYVGARQMYVIKHVSLVCLGLFEDYAGIHQSRGEAKISSTKILAYGVPLFTAVTWVIGISLTLVG